MILESITDAGSSHCEKLVLPLGFPSGAVLKKPSAKAGHSGDVGSIPRSGRCPREGIVTHSNILAWKISWTEDSGRLQSSGLQRARHD